MLESFWKKILRRRGLSLLAIPAFLLWLLSFVYRAVLVFAIKFQAVPVKLKLPVVSIGNITVGGTGKTPILSTIARFLINEGHKVGIVSSAYGCTEPISFVKEGYEVAEMSIAQTGDEVMLLADALPEAILSVHKIKSVAAQRAAAAEYQLDVLLVDDGFQHWQLQRDINIITYDAAIPRSQLKMFPYGVLREPLKALKRADVIVITRSKFTKDIARLSHRLKRISPCAEIYSARFLLGELVGLERRLPAKYLEDKAVFLFAGIGNFRSFEKQVRSLTRHLDHTLELADHQVYTDDLLGKIKSLADKYDSEIILTTGKDWFKVRHFDFGRELYYLSQIVDIDPGEEKLVSHLLKRIGVSKKVG